MKELQDQRADFSGKFSITNFIDSFDMNKETWALFALLGFAMLFEGYDFFIVNFTLPSIRAEWALSSLVTGSLSSWSLIGLVIGGIISGPLADRFGRKTILVACMLVFGTFNLPLYFSQDWVSFAVFRVLAGVGLGSCIPMVTTSFSEWMPSRRRAFFITFGMAWMAIGAVIAGMVAGALCKAGTVAAINAGKVTFESAATLSLPFISGLQVDSWRVCYFIGAVPLLYALLLVFRMPESPHFYASKGKLDKCIKQLQLFEKRVTGKGDISASFKPEQLIIPHKSKKAGPSSIFSKNLIRGTLAIWIGYFCGCMIVYGLNAWLPMMVGAMGYSYSIAIIANIAVIFANVFTGIGSDKLGRKKNILLGFGSGIVFIALTSVAVINNWPFLILAVIIIVLNFTVNWGQTGLQPLMPEVYPTEIRGTGVAWCQAVGRIGGALGPIIFGFCLDAAMSMGIETVPAMGLTFLFTIVPSVAAMLGIGILVKKEYAGRRIDEV